MRFRGAIIGVGILFLSTCRLCFSQAALDHLYATAPLDGITPENAAEKIAPYLQAAEAAQSDEDKGKLYAYLAMDLSSRISNPLFQDRIIEIADKALAYNIPRPLRIEVYEQKGSAVRMKNYKARGEALRAPRREVGRLFLMGLRDIAAQLADFDKQHPGFDPDKIPPRPGPEGFERTAPPEKMEAYNQWGQTLAEYRNNHTILQQGHGEAMKKALLDIYARRPYDTDELRALTLEITGDAKLAEWLVSEVKKWIQAREKDMMGDDVKQITRDVLDAGTTFPKETPRASFPITASPAPAPQAPIAPSSPPPRSPWAVVAVVVVVCLAGGLVARVVFRRMKTR
jgi:hypothetical protein